MACADTPKGKLQIANSICSRWRGSHQDFVENAGAGAALVQRHEDFNLGESHSGDQGFPVSSPPPSLLLGPSSRPWRKNSHLRQIGPFRVW